jgi:RHS repeat-associated protein
VVLVKQGSGSWSLYYICRDYLGSITHVTNASGTLQQELSYDAWGRLRSPANQTVYAPDAQPTLFLGRGFTGHEHLPLFGLINMNARLYDPALGRFLSPDPYVQMPDFSQNFNRYTYALNNPLVYTDESGEFISTILSAVVNFFWNVGRTFSQGIHAWTGKEDWRMTYNGWRIDTGWLRGSFKQIVSRFTWELPQSLVGYLWSTSRNVTGSVDNVEFFDGATFVINENASKNNGVSIGSFLNINDKDKMPTNADGKFDPTFDHLYMHEYGHYIQSQEYGWGYLVSVGVPSLFSAKNSKSLGDDELNPYGLETHDTKWYELRANKKASKYFGEKYGVMWNSNMYPRDRTEIDPILLRTAEIQLYNRWYRKSIWERVEYSKQKTKL